MRRFKKTNSISLLHAVMLACSVCTATSTLAQTVPVQQPLGWSGKVGVQVVSAPTYEGGANRSTSLAPGLSLSYKTSDWGSFGFGDPGIVSWTFLDKKDYQLGVYLGADGGRKDKKSNRSALGGGGGDDKLKGLGEIKASSELGLQFSTTALGGIPLFINAHRGSGGAIEVGSNKRKGHGGLQVDVGASLPIPLTKELTFSLSPSVTWASQKYMDAYFGVTPAQAAASSFKQFNAKSGVRKVDLNLGLDYKITKDWSAQASVGISRLTGSAKNSPISAKDTQVTTALGASYSF